MDCRDRALLVEGCAVGAYKSKLHITKNKLHIRLQPFVGITLGYQDREQPFRRAVRV
jgi:hypothetical protein